jgi:hypothetical protein
VSIFSVEDGGSGLHLNSTYEYIPTAQCDMVEDHGSGDYSARGFVC